LRCDGGKTGLLQLLADWAYLVCIVAFLVICRRLYRRMEIRADAVARSLEPAPGVYAGALEKLYAANLVPVVITSRPHRYAELYDRLVQAGGLPRLYSAACTTLRTALPEFGGRPGRHNRRLHRHSVPGSLVNPVVIEADFMSVHKTLC
jgi:hypothetical protein